MSIFDDYCVFLCHLWRRTSARKLKNWSIGVSLFGYAFDFLTCLKQIWAWNFLQEVQLPKPLEALNDVQTPHCPTSNQALTKYCGFSTHEPSGIQKHVRRDEIIMWKIELRVTLDFHMSH